MGKHLRFAYFGILVAGASFLLMGCDPPTPPAMVDAPTISGTVVLDQQLTATTGSWTPEPSSYETVWERCKTVDDCAAVGTGSTYTVTTGDYGRTLRVKVTATGANGGAATAVSAATAPVGFGSCTDPTITWDGGAGTSAWGTAANWSPDRLPMPSDYVCIGDPSAAVAYGASGTPTVKGIQAAGSLTLPNGLTTTDTAYASRLATTTVNAGQLGSRLAFLPTSTVTLATNSSKTLFGVQNWGTMRIEGTGTSIQCIAGQPSGVDNYGLIELRAESSNPIIGGSSAGCTPTLRNRNSAVVAKPAGTGTGTAKITAAVINDGGLGSDAGTLALAGGSVTTNWSGTGSTGSEANPSLGLYWGRDGTVAFTGGTHTFGPSTLLYGNLTAAGGTINGSANIPAGVDVKVDWSTIWNADVNLVDATSSFTAKGGTINGLVSGPGTLDVNGGILQSDITAGGPRYWSYGDMSGTRKVLPGATFTVRDGGYHSEWGSLENLGTIRIETTGWGTYCTVGQSSGIENRGVIELRKESSTSLLSGGGNNCTAALRNNAGATIVKPAGTGTGTSTLGIAIINEGEIRSDSGTLGLGGGTVTNNWTGTGSTTPATNVPTGIYNGNGTGTVSLAGGTHWVGTPTQLAGNITITGNSKVEGQLIVPAGMNIQMFWTGQPVLNATTNLTTSTSALTAKGGTINGLVSGPGTLDVNGGILQSDITAGGPRYWSYGDMSGTRKVLPGATFTVRDGGYHSEWGSLENLGTIRIETTGWGTYCTVGQSSGIENRGVIELRKESSTSLLSGGGNNCTAALRNNAGATIVKPAGTGTGTSTLGIAIINDGIITSKSGTVSLTGGTATNNWTGTGSTTPQPNIPDGTYWGDGGTVTFAATTNALDQDTILKGSLGLAAGTMTGPRVNLQPNATLNVTGGTLQTPLHGGFLVMTGGTLAADIYPGQVGPDPADPTRSLDQSRQVGNTSVLASTSVTTGATMTLTNQLYMPANSSITVHGTLAWPSSVPYFLCSTCRLTVASDGVLNVRRTPSPWVQVFRVSTGTFDNQGEILVSGDFPGVDIAFTSNANVIRKGMARVDLDQPLWLTQISENQYLNAIAAAAPKTGALTNLVMRAASLALSGPGPAFLNQNFVGSCTNLTLTGNLFPWMAGLGVPAGVTASVCTIIDSGGTEALSVTFGTSLGTSFVAGVPSFAGVTLEQGAVVGFGQGTSGFTVDNMAGYFACDGLNAGISFGMPVEVGLSGSHCWGADAETAFDLGVSDFSKAGNHTYFGGVSVGKGFGGPSVGSVTFARTNTYSAVLKCSSWNTSLYGACPAPPRITSMSSYSGTTAGGQSLTINVKNLQPGSSVRLYRYDPNTGAVVSNVSVPVQSSTSSTITVTLPSAVPGAARVVVLGPTGDTDAYSDPLVSTYTFVAPPPPP